MKIAIMQPYFYPYIGYFELVKSVDLFVFLDDVQFTRKGWINRNRIRSKDKIYQSITVPVRNHSRGDKISEILIYESDWNDYMIRLFKSTYGNLPVEFIEHFTSLKKHIYLKDCLIDSVSWCCKELNISTPFLSSSGISLKKGKDKLIDICNYFNADVYVNASGGEALYSKNDFLEHSINLEFMNFTSYHNKFSIIDVFLVDSKEKAKNWISNF